MVRQIIKSQSRLEDIRNIWTNILFRVSVPVGRIASLEEIRLAQLRQKCFCISYLPSKQVIRIILFASYKPKSRPLFPFQLFMADPLQKLYVNMYVSALRAQGLFTMEKS